MRRITCLALCALAGIYGAIAGQPAASDGANAQSCIDVEVNGERVPAYDCLTDKLTPAESREPRTAAQLGSEQIARRPSNELDLFNQAATRQRMGNAFGKSVQAQRPAVAPAASPLVRRP